MRFIFWLKQFLFKKGGLYVLPHLICLVLGVKFWPFSDYDMYTYNYQKITDHFELVAFNKDEEVFVSEAAIYFPIEPNGFYNKMKWLMSLEDRDFRLQKLLKYFYKRIENRYPDWQLNKLEVRYYKLVLTSNEDAELSKDYKVIASYQQESTDE